MLGFPDNTLPKKQKARPLKKWWETILSFGVSAYIQGLLLLVPGSVSRLKLEIRVICSSQQLKARPTTMRGGTEAEVF